MAETKTGVTALVTGGNRGIGLEICRQLAKRGARVLMGSRDPARGEAARARLGADGAGIRVVALDLADAASITAAAAAIAGDPGTLDILINNAGVFDKA